VNSDVENITAKQTPMNDVLGIERETPYQFSKTLRATACIIDYSGPK